MDLDVASAVQQQVFELEVAVDDVELVQVRQRQQNLCHVHLALSNGRWHRRLFACTVCCRFCVAKKCDT